MDRTKSNTTNRYNTTITSATFLQQTKVNMQNRTKMKDVISRKAKYIGP